ncbi:holliday junction resolvase [Microbacterium phage Barnstormer]|uniref:Holliday junction resolvase n=1 Tax=Microbacterium phage Barnstormer TaxID=3028491 RepID=A0AAF0CJB4_9CAUD|nr:holliday junction resolvase [Microbacterium phage Barnstormer]WDS52149.1 holliday junction resolvase [Microbacterium phage UtzChips]
MANAAKRKGTAYESAIVKELNAGGIPARRVAQTGALDLGDIHGIDPFVGQCKAYRDLASALRDGVAGANVQAMRAGRPYGVAFIKRPGKPIADGYAVMDVATFTRLLSSIQALPEGYDYD